ncbi:MAG: hypothetical protein P1V51_07140 [Deltaproteobacteria bacterium]|nr:hypothetical protein [Deltaproteobacteria bacterium]
MAGRRRPILFLVPLGIVAVVVVGLELGAFWKAKELADAGPREPPLSPMSKVERDLYAVVLPALEAEEPGSALALRLRRSLARVGRSRQLPGAPAGGAGIEDPRSETPPCGTPLEREICGRHPALPVLLAPAPGEGAVRPELEAERRRLRKRLRASAEEAPPTDPLTAALFLEALSARPSPAAPSR